jgi:hypothetical protein
MVLFGLRIATVILEQVVIVGRNSEAYCAERLYQSKIPRTVRLATSPPSTFPGFIKVPFAFHRLGRSIYLFHPRLHAHDRALHLPDRAFYRRDRTPGLHDKTVYVWDRRFYVFHSPFYVGKSIVLSRG